MRGLHYTACVIAVGTATAALAHGSATGIVKERMDGMIVLRDSMKAMGPMMLGKTEYDGAVVRARASAIRQHSGEALSSLFPQGSGGMPSEATDAVWEDWERFIMIADRLETLAVALEAGATNGPDEGGYGRHDELGHDAGNDGGRHVHADRWFHACRHARRCPVHDDRQHLLGLPREVPRQDAMTDQ
jgi:cytochrome c556